MAKWTLRDLFYCPLYYAYWDCVDEPTPIIESPETRRHLHHFFTLGNIVLTQAIPPIATHFFVAWSVVCLPFVCPWSATFVHLA